jgi:CheY-like chemotaxis protein
MTETGDTKAAGKGKILCVDDDQDVLVMLNAVLSSSGYETVLAHDGEEGVQVFKNRKSELVAVVMDVRMPVKNGFEAAREMRAESADMPLIAVSAYFGGQKNNAQARQITDSGFNTYTSKPFNIDFLLTTIDSLVQQYRAKAG